MPAPRGDVKVPQRAVVLIEMGIEKGAECAVCALLKTAPEQQPGGQGAGDPPISIRERMPPGQAGYPFRGEGRWVPRRATLLEFSCEIAQIAAGKAAGRHDRGRPVCDDPAPPDDGRSLAKLTGPSRGCADDDLVDLGKGFERQLAGTQSVLEEFCSGQHGVPLALPPSASRLHHALIELAGRNHADLHRFGSQARSRTQVLYCRAYLPIVRHLPEAGEGPALENPSVAVPSAHHLDGRAPRDRPVRPGHWQCLSGSSVTNSEVLASRRPGHTYHPQQIPRVLRPAHMSDIAVQERGPTGARRAVHGKALPQQCTGLDAIPVDRGEVSLNGPRKPAACVAHASNWDWQLRDRETGSAEDPGRVRMERGLARHLIEKQALIIGCGDDRGAQRRDLVPPSTDGRGPQVAEGSAGPDLLPILISPVEHVGVSYPPTVSPSWTGAQTACSPALTTGAMHSHRMVL